MTFTVVFSILTIICFIPSEQSLIELNETFYEQSRIPEDGRLGFKALAGKYNLHCEEHEVTTEDKYILKLFRITPRTQSNGYPILLLHGLLDSSDTYLIRGKSSLLYNLSEHNDLWVGNMRGNKYSRRHETLNPDVDKAFWDFSFHEYGHYDCAAYIDYILKKTGKSKVNIIAHSLGTTASFVLCSTRPEYNDKINVLIAMGPACYLHNIRGIVKLVKKPLAALAYSLEATGVVQIFNEKSVERRFLQDVCTQEIGYDLCFEGFAFPLAGRDAEELEPAFVPIALGHFLSGTSTKTFHHLIQSTNTERFARYDYGAAVNLVKYGSVKPPSYDLSKVTCQVVLMVGKNDFLTTVKDAKILKDKLSNVEYFEMPRENFNHIDFVWGKSMNYTLFPYIYNMLNKYSLQYFYL